ncbi:MAG: QueT transporter family protein [Bacillota bacterium]|nr:QueT transporter family protein [Bacillota bacterium]MDI7249020.1 QueT transporter family protein [Bacillota bacterium]
MKPAAYWGRVAAIGAVYAALTLLPPLRAISYGMIQVRVAEALTVLPYITPAAIPGLFVGCLVANVVGGLGPVDMVLGSLTTLVAAWLTSRAGAVWLAPLPPVVLNALVVGSYVPLLLGLRVPLPVGWAWVGLGEAVACYGLGFPLLLYLLRRPRLCSLLRGVTSQST